MRLRSENIVCPDLNKKKIFKFGKAHEKNNFSEACVGDKKKGGVLGTEERRLERDSLSLPYA
jgi:hypothetical protein